MADYLAKRGANIAPSYATTDDLPASTQAGDLVFVGGQLGIAVDASTFKTCDNSSIADTSGTLDSISAKSYSPLTTPVSTGTSGNTQFGARVAISDPVNHMIISNYMIAGPGGYTADPQHGAYYVYTMPNGTYQRTIACPISNLDYAQFGITIAIAHTSNGGYGYASLYKYNSNQGRVYIHNLSNGNLVRSLTGTSVGDRFGWEVAASPLYTLVGAPYRDSQVGRAYLYNNSDGALKYTFEGAGTTSGQFGYRVAVCDNYSLVTEQYQRRYHVFDNSTGNKLYTTEAIGTIHYAWKVAMSDHFHIVSSDAYSSDAKVLVYNNHDGSLKYTINKPAAATTSYSGSGQGVAISDAYFMVSDTGYQVSSQARGASFVHSMATGNLLHTLTGDVVSMSMGTGQALTSTILAIGGPANGTAGGEKVQVHA